LNNIFSINHNAPVILKKKNSSLRSWIAGNSKLNYATEDPNMVGGV
jgi:hypothetical protein